MLVTGPSGAGRSTAINALEDLGYECIDNLPLGLLPRLLEGPALSRPIALGIDARNRDFSLPALAESLERIAALPSAQAEVLYLDCSPAVLLRRFSETRRRHPLAPEEAPELGIARELDLLTDLRKRADWLIDTTDMTPHDLRATLTRSLAPRASDGEMAVTVASFSYKRGVPAGADMVLDCRFLANPHWVPELRALSGLNISVRDHVQHDPRYDEFWQRVRDLMDFLLPAYRDEGKAHFSIAFGCTGGRHRSVTLAENLAHVLESEGWRVNVTHRELGNGGLFAPPEPTQEGKAKA